MKLFPCLYLLLWGALLGGGDPTPKTHPTAQVVGTVMEGRGAWNPFDEQNQMQPDGRGGFQRTQRLSPKGGRNGDGIYAMRFFLNQDLRSVRKRGSAPGHLVGGTQAGNIVFRVKREADYTVRFLPKTNRYVISPAVEELTRIESFQLNGFVHDREGSTECFDGRRTRPAEKWDEWMPSHECTPQADGSWSITLPLSPTGGHERNGVYQCLFSANHLSDWGYSAILGEPGRLAGGNGYDSRVGRIEETAIVFRVSKEGKYTFTVWPDSYRFTVSPEVEWFPEPKFQVNGDVVADPWNPAAPEHAMEKGSDGRWSKRLKLSPTGGPLGKGIYTMNFSLDGNWALDSIGFGGVWGRTWHSAPQEWNLLFRVETAGEYWVTLDPAEGSYAIEPAVRPFTTVESLQISGDFEALAADGQKGWNPVDPSHAMERVAPHQFTKDLLLQAGKTYSYKYTANWAGWAWSLVDYPYDGYRRLAPHGNPPPLTYTCPRTGLYRFSADVRSGAYGVTLLELR